MDHYCSLQLQQHQCFCLHAQHKGWTGTKMKKDNIAKNYQNVCHWHHEAAQSLVQRHPGRVTTIKQVNKQMNVRE